MKKYIKLIALAGLACQFAVSCKHEENPEPVKPASLTAPTLSVTPANVVVSPESEETALTFSWNDVAVEGITPVYAFQITKKGDTDFASGTAYECASTEKKFSHAELVALAGEIGASLDEGFSLIARVRVTAKDKKDIAAVMSNVVEAAVSKEQYPIENLYPIGNGTPYGWSQDKTVAMEKNGTTFTWTGHLYANAEFKFLLQNDGNWWPGVVNKTDDPYNYEPVIGFSDAEDKKFKVNKEGKYTITIDASNTNALTMNVEFIDDDIQELVVEHLYILGGATKTGWSLDDMEEFVKKGNTFTWEGSLTEGGEFRFPMQRDWWPCLMIAMDGETLVKGVSDDEKTGYTVDETAIYKILCDIDNMKVYIAKTGDIAPPEFPTLYMCGDATPYGWSTVMTDEKQLKPVESGNVNVLSWTGELKADGIFKFLTCSDWIPSYNRDATAEEYWTLAYRATYDDPDEQFAVSEDGTYKVVVDLDAMKVTCTKEQPASPSITIDGDPSDWEGAANVVSLECPADAEMTGLLSAKILYSDKLYFLVQLSDEAIADGKVRLHVYFDTDDFGCQAARWIDNSIDYMLEGKMTSGGAFVKFSSAFHKFIGTQPTDWENCWPATDYTPVFESAGNGSWYELSMSYDGYPGGLPEQFKIGLDEVNSGWDIIGYLPQTQHMLVIKKNGIAEQPEEPGGETASITIDGNMSDWASIEGATGEGINAAFKVASDEDNLYFYVKRTTERMSELWGGAAYHYYTFDLDNNPETGEELWGNGPYDLLLVIYPYAGSADAPDFGIAASGTVVPSGYTVAHAVIKGVVTDSGVETEIAVPRADLPTIPTTPVTVYSWSNKGGGDKLEVTCTL